MPDSVRIRIHAINQTGLGHLDFLIDRIENNGKITTTSKCTCMHHYRFNRAALGAYVLTAVLAGLFVSAGVKSLTGQLARFPDHYLFNLVGAIALSWFYTGPREVVVLRKIARFTWKKAAKAYTYSGRLLAIHVRGAARSLAALFTLPSNRPQTEP